MDGKPVIIPMVGKVIAVKVKVGDVVCQNDVLAILESMKMEIPVFAKAAGIVQELDAAVGQVLRKGHVLAILA